MSHQVEPNAVPKWVLHGVHQGTKIGYQYSVLAIQSVFSNSVLFVNRLRCVRCFVYFLNSSGDARRPSLEVACAALCAAGAFEAGIFSVFHVFVPRHVFNRHSGAILHIMRQYDTASWNNIEYMMTL